MKKFPALDAGDVDDICQSAWESLYRYRDVEAKGHVAEPLAFLCQGAKWAALRMVKQNRKVFPVQEPAIREADPGPHALLEAELSDRQVLSLLDLLSDHERRVARLMFQGLQRQQVAAQLGMSLREVDHLWDTARARLVELDVLQGDSLLRMAIVKANRTGKLPNRMRCLLDRAAANSPRICLEIATSLLSI